MEFDAPLEFAFRWYADCRSDDTVRVGEHYEQWILRRSRNRVLYEDLRRARDGW